MADDSDVISRIRGKLMMLCAPCHTTTPYIPDGQAVGLLLGKIDRIVTELTTAALHKIRLDELNAALTGLRTPKAVNTVADIPMKGDTVDNIEWAKKPEAEKRRIWETLSAVHEELRYLNSDSLACGKRYFVTFSVLFIVVVSMYLCVHRQDVRHQLQPTITPQTSIEILRQARLIELQLASLKESQNRMAVATTPPALPVPSRQAEPPKAIENPAQPAVSLTAPSLATEQEKECKKPDPMCLLKGLKGTLYTLPLPYETMRLLGTASAELEAGDITIHVTYQSLLKHLQADLESLSTAYFWTSHPWRWLELSLWATMGCLVGLLFYIAGLLGQGIFRREEGTMFWAELLMAPIVVPVVFFLFALSGITDFIPSQASVTVNIGVAFIFGFAIRRTIGLLDIIKKRFFPDPLPGSASPGS